MKLAWLGCRGRSGAEVGEAGASARAFSARLAREAQGPDPTRRSRRSRATRVLVALGLLGVLGWSLRAAVGSPLMVAPFLAQQARDWRCGGGRADPGRAWRRGARGERETAKELRPLTRRGWVVLHDRVIPGCPGNVDHIVVGPTGIHVVDSKLWSG